MVKVKEEVVSSVDGVTCKWRKVAKRVSGYQFFLRACLDEMKSQYPDSSIVLSEVSKLCGENWQVILEMIGCLQLQAFKNERDYLFNSIFVINYNFILYTEYE